MNEILKKASIVGFVRYSQKNIFGDFEKKLFEPDYFEYRFEIFTNITLKSFRQQTDKDFVLIILHSETIPPHYKKRFVDLEDTNPFLHNLFVSDNIESFNESNKKSVNHVSFEEEVAITFRIDNDDAVQNDFINSLKKFLKSDFVGFTINMPTNLIIKRVGNQSYMIEEKYYPSNSIGLAYVTTRNNYKTVMAIEQHHLINDENAMVLLAKNSTAGLMTINGDNAVNTINPLNAKVFNEAEFQIYLKKHKFENLDLTCLRIFEESNISSISFFKKIIALFFPPIFFMILHKIRDNFSS